MPHVTLSDPLVETVRARALRVYNEKRLTWRDMAGDIGCNPAYLYQFMQRVHGNTGLCLSIMRTYPEIADGILIERKGVYYLRVSEV